MEEQEIITLFMRHVDLLTARDAPEAKPWLETPHDFK